MKDKEQKDLIPDLDDLLTRGKVMENYTISGTIILALDGKFYWVDDGGEVKVRRYDDGLDEKRGK